MEEYDSKNFDKHFAYDQRQRKLLLVAGGRIDGFKVNCESPKKAQNLAHGFKLRSRRLEKSEDVKYRLKVKVDRKTIYVTRKGPIQR